MYYTYVLISEKDGKKYVGYTKDLKLRFEQHKNGQVESTKHRRPLKLVYYEVHPVKCLLPLFNQGLLERGRCQKTREISKDT